MPLLMQIALISSGEMCDMSIDKASPHTNDRKRIIANSKYGGWRPVMGNTIAAEITARIKQTDTGMSLTGMVDCRMKQMISNLFLTDSSVKDRKRYLRE